MRGNWLTITLNAFFFVVGLLAAGLALTIAYLMFKSFKAIGREYLLGFSVGFVFLALSFGLFGASYMFAVAGAATASLVRLFLSSYGFGFIAATYSFKKRSTTRSSCGEAPRIVFVVLIVFAVATILLILMPSAPSLPLYEVGDEAFHVVNLGLLAYVVYNVNQALKTEVELSNVMLGFTLLVIDQYSLLLWALDSSFLWSLVFAQLVRIGGLVTLSTFMVRGFQRA